MINIGGAIGFWGESQIGTPQLLKQGNLDYIVYDYLAEITLSIISRAKINDPEKGYAIDFITKVINQFNNIQGAINIKIFFEHCFFILKIKK